MVFLAVAIVLAVGCADLERGPRTEVPDASTSDALASDGGALRFGEVRALLTSGCARCHATGEMASNTKFLLGGDEAADYRASSAFVDVKDPAGSRLLVKAAGQGHTGGTIYRPGSPEHTALLTWIQAGARP